MKQVEEEYYKSDEKTAHLPNAHANHTGSPIELYPNSPEKPLTSIQQTIPEPVKQAVNDIIKSQKTIGIEEGPNSIQYPQESYPTYVYSLDPSIKNPTS